MAVSPCITTISFYMERGLPTTQVLRRLSGVPLQAVFDNVVVAEYRCYDSWRTRKVEAIREGVFYPTRHASSQGVLIPFDPQESLLLYRPQSERHHARRALPSQQLALFEWTSTA